MIVLSEFLKFADLNENQIKMALAGRSYNQCGRIKYEMQKALHQYAKRHAFDDIQSAALSNILIIDLIQWRRFYKAEFKRRSRNDPGFQKLSAKGRKIRLRQEYESAMKAQSY